MPLNDLSASHLIQLRSTWRRLPADVMASLTALAAGLLDVRTTVTLCAVMVGGCRLLLFAASELRASASGIVVWQCINMINMYQMSCAMSDQSEQKPSRNRAGLAVLVPKVALRDASAEMADLSLTQWCQWCQWQQVGQVGQAGDAEDQLMSAPLRQGCHSSTFACQRWTQALLDLQSTHFNTLWTCEAEFHSRSQQSPWPTCLPQQQCCSLHWEAHRRNMHMNRLKHIETIATWKIWCREKQLGSRWRTDRNSSRVKRHFLILFGRGEHRSETG